MYNKNLKNDNLYKYYTINCLQTLRKKLKIFCLLLLFESKLKTKQSDPSYVHI